MEIIEQIGSYAGYAAIVGLAILSALYFSQARDVRRLREWAGKAPERGGEGATTGQRVVARPMPTPPGGTQAAGAKGAQAGTTRTAPVPGALPGRQPPPVPRPGGAAAAAAGAGPAVATGPAAATPAAARAAGAAPQSPAQAGGGGNDVVSQDTVAHPPPRPPGEGADEADGDGDDATVVEGGAGGAAAAGAGGAAGAAAGAAAGGAAGGAGPGAADRNGRQDSGEQDAARDDSGSWTGEDDAAREESGSWTGEGDAAREDSGQWTGEGDAVDDEDYDDYDEDEEYEDEPAAGDTGDRPVPMIPPTAPRPPTIPPRPPAPVGSGTTRGGSILPPYEQSRPGGAPAGGRLRGRGRTIALVAAAVLVLAGAAFAATTLLGGDDGGSGSDAQRSSAPAGDGSGGTVGAQGAIDPSSVTVAVLNGTTVDGLAADVGETLTAEGYQLGTVTNGSDQARAESVVLFAPGARREAEDVARRLNIGQREPIDAESQGLAGDATIVVVTGADRIE